MRNFSRWAFGFLAIMLLPLSAHAVSRDAGTFRVGPQEAISGSIIEAARVVEIAGSVTGDVIVAGNTVKISGPVAGDVIVAGNSVTISGPVGGSIRAVAGNLVIEGQVARNAFVMTNKITLSKNTSVGWDVFALADTLQLEGAVQGNLWVNARDVNLTGNVGKNVSAAIDPGGQITLGPSAQVEGMLTYQAPNKDQLHQSAQAKVTGQVVHRLPPAGSESPSPFSGVFFLMRTISIFALLAVGLVLVSLLPRKVLAVNAEMLAKPWQSLGWGALVCLFTPIVLAVLAFTLIGIPLGLILGALWLIAVYVSKVFAGFTLGLLALNVISPAKKFTGSLLWPLILGMVVLGIIGSLPWVGWVVGWLLSLWALGALVRVERVKLAEYR